jgi:hypothetical protein
MSGATISLQLLQHTLKCTIHISHEEFTLLDTPYQISSTSQIHLEILNNLKRAKGYLSIMEEQTRYLHSFVA